MSEKKTKKQTGDIEDHSEEIQSLHDEVVSLQTEKERLNEAYLRLAAEYDNYKKRQTKNFGEMVSAARDALILKILEVLDNFERAIERSEEPLSQESLIEGIQLIHKQFSDLLKSESISTVCEVGDEFDPALHEAVALLPSDCAENTVVGILQKGYRCGDRLIRPAKVIVSETKNTGEEAQS